MIKKYWMIMLLIVLAILLQYFVGFPAIWSSILVPAYQNLAGFFAGLSQTAVGSLLAGIGGVFIAIGQGIGIAVATVTLSTAASIPILVSYPIIAAMLGAVIVGLNIWGLIKLYKFIKRSLIRSQECKHDTDVVMQEQNIPKQYRNEVRQAVNGIRDSIEEIELSEQYRILLALAIKILSEESQAITLLDEPDRAKKLEMLSQEIAAGNFDLKNLGKEECVLMLAIARNLFKLYLEKTGKDNNRAVVFTKEKGRFSPEAFKGTMHKLLVNIFDIAGSGVILFINTAQPKQVVQEQQDGEQCSTAVKYADVEQLTVPQGNCLKEGLLPDGLVAAR
jgi:hypothetical protein